MARTNTERNTSTGTNFFRARAIVPLLLLRGTLTDRDAAEAVGISPGQAAYVKAKPRVKAYMDEHRASVRVGLVQHEVDALVELNIGREQILTKWWEFANIDPKLTGYK